MIIHYEALYGPIIESGIDIFSFFKKHFTDKKKHRNDISMYFFLNKSRKRYVTSIIIIIIISNKYFKYFI